jgi:glycosidase
MKGSRGNANTDANRRLAMLWGDKDTVKDPIGTTYKKELQVNGTVKSQEKDKNSLLNHYKKLVQIRNAYPEIARGEYHSIETNMNYFGGFTSTYNSSTIGVFHNASTKELTIDLSKYADIKFSELKSFAGLNEAKFENGTLVIGGQTSVILK